jgi:phenylacetate-CoA ligase
MRPRRTPLEAWAAARLGVGEGPPTRAALEAAQLARLRETLAWAARQSPLYRERLAAAAPLGSLGDLGTLPFTTAQDLRDEGERLLCVSQDEVSRVVTLQSSGTTGARKRLRFTAAEQESIVDFFQHGMSTLVGPGDRVLVLLPGPTPGSVGALLAAALARLGAEPVPHGFVQDLTAAAEAVRRSRPTSVVGAPVQVLALHRYAEEVAGTPFRPRTALLTTDHVPESLVRRLRDGAGIEVFEHYGMTEMGLGGAVDCEAHAGYHLREPDLYLELVDPATGQVVPEGVPGEIVLTTLTRRGMPLVRYRTGDLSRFVPAPCPCGSALRRLDRVRGRTDARAVPCGPGGAAVTLPELDEALFALPELVDFSAAVGTGPRPSLRIAACSLDGDAGLARSALEALRELPALRSAEAAGALAIEVEVARLPERPWPDPRKRTLTALVEGTAGPHAG